MANAPIVGLSASQMTQLKSYQLKLFKQVIPQSKDLKLSVLNRKAKPQAAPLVGYAGAPQPVKSYLWNTRA